jgi:hypothetical protein
MEFQASTSKLLLFHVGCARRADVLGMGRRLLAKSGLIPVSEPGILARQAMTANRIDATSMSEFGKPRVGHPASPPAAAPRAYGTLVRTEESNRT